MDSFDFISPLDYRYLGRKKELMNEVKPFLSENARIKYQSKVEAALAKALAKQKVCGKKIAIEIAKACEKVTAKEVYQEEDRIKHDIRALANAIRKRVSKKAKPFVHFCATSYDIVDTSSALRYKDTANELILPSLKQLEKQLIKLALREKKTLQIGRTHGQHAEPISFGFALSSYVSRLGGRIKAVEEAKNNLCGKFSGAVGAYNSSSLFIRNPLELEKAVMKEIGLKTSLSSTQIVEPEPLVDLMHALVSSFSVIANMADDFRHLQRTEISELAEGFEAKQVGSSTMPHKRNPINFENIKSLWKEFMPRSITFYLDQLSEHQRDLTNSASQRFIPEVFAGLFLASEKMASVLEKMIVDKKKMKENFDENKEKIVAEPLYLLLAFHAHPDAHEAVRELTFKAQKTGKKPLDLAREDKKLKKYLEKFTEKQRKVVENPEEYIGLAEKKTELICAYWKKELKIK